MRLIRGRVNIPFPKTPVAATIGNFDGLHLAHQQLLQRVINAAKKIDGISVVIIFEPTPQEFFLGKNAPARLSSLREKLTLFRSQKIDYVWLLPFNKTLSELSGEDFVQAVLLNHLNLKQLIIGDDFQFGKNRTGDFALLQKFAQQHNFQLTRTAEMSHGDARVSSTRIRQCLAEGDLVTAAQLLGRPYTITGRVLHGAKRGRQLGFPTANIALKRKVVALSGVYAVKIHGLNNRIFTGVANIGTRPTVDGTRTLLEVHLFDFSEQIYGHLINVEFCHKLRPEQRFESLDDLKAQIAQDVVDAKQFFN